MGTGKGLFELTLLLLNFFEPYTLAIFSFICNHWDGGRETCTFFNFKDSHDAIT